MEKIIKLMIYYGDFMDENTMIAHVQFSMEADAEITYEQIVLDGLINALGMAEYFSFDGNIYKFDLNAIKVITNFRNFNKSWRYDAPDWLIAASLGVGAILGVKK